VIRDDDDGDDNTRWFLILIHDIKRDTEVFRFSKRCVKNVCMCPELFQLPDHKFLSPKPYNPLISGRFVPNDS
jgi:hypothetical protein